MAKKKHPETSFEAYHRLTSGHLNSHYGKIIKAFEVLGSATADKIAEYTGLDHVQVNRRFVELRRMDMIYNTKLKLPTRRGTNAFVHTLATKGKIIEHQTEKAPAGESVSDFYKNIKKIRDGIPKNNPQQIINFVD